MDLGDIATNTSNISDKITASSSDTLTNKSIDLATNTLTGSLAEFNSALESESFVGLAATQTLTNKTLTTPVITQPTLRDSTDNTKILAFGLASIGSGTTRTLTMPDGDVTLSSGTIPSRSTSAGNTELAFFDANANLDRNASLTFDGSELSAGTIVSTRLAMVTPSLTNGGATLTVATHGGRGVVWGASTAGTLTLPASPTVGDQFMLLNQSTANNLYALPASGGTIIRETTTTLFNGTALLVEPGTASTFICTAAGTYIMLG